MINFTPFPNIETKNLILRRMGYKDIDDLFKMRKDPRMNEFTDTKPDKDIGETRAYIDKMNRGVDDNKWIIWAIEHKQSDEVIGTISIWNIDDEQKSGELGYGIIPDYQGQGLMKEALLGVVEYGFGTMGLDKLDAYTEENNHKSTGLLERCNFIETGRVDDEPYFNKRVYRMVIYSLDKIID